MLTFVTGVVVGVIGWWRGLGTSDRLAVVGIVVGVALAAVGPLRRALVGLVRASLRRTGRDERRYAAWFVRQWGVYDNPYLDDKEDLDLDNTYVSLSLCPPDSDEETRAAAAAVLADRTGGNLMIEGDPGSGKSTLLRAYGVGVLKGARGVLFRRRRPDTQIPFFVQLRKLSRRLDADGAVAAYLIDEVLRAGAEFSPPEACEFLRRTLTEGRALVMLDGLDEITADHQQAVLEAVYAFITDRSPELPTAHARVVVTCRRQNFIALREQWVPAITPTVSTVIPLRNAEIFAYLDKLRPKFRAAGGPEAFLNAVRLSGTLDLHRTPLVLAMSVGLYARKDFYEIPGSIAELYRTMIREMLDRQRFKRDPGGAAVLLPVDDKYRFLREFALTRACGPGGFDDFSRRDMLALATTLAPSLREVDDPTVLVAEVADRSGLVDDVSERGHYVFAHRSLHEYLVAEELLALPTGEALLLGRATDPEWRQVVLFFAAALEQRRADAFLPALAQRDVTLAGHCLAVAVPSDAVAGRILERLVTVVDPLLVVDRAHLAALVAATTSPRRTVQEMAVRRLERELKPHTPVWAVLQGDVDGTLPLLGALAGSNAVRIAALVPQLVIQVPDDPRLVEPLWRCLTVTGIERRPESRAIVQRLLTVAMDDEGFDALQRQEPYTRPFLDAALRHRAYPFRNGLPPTCNLVTLLAWAEHLDVWPGRDNRYFDAKAAGRLERVEVDKSRTIEFSLFWPARIASFAAAFGGIAAFAAVVSADWRLMLRPLGWWTPVVSLVLGAGAFAVLLYLVSRDDSRYRGAHYINVFARRIPNDAVGFPTLFSPPVAWALAVPPLVAGPLWAYLLAAGPVPLLLFWLPMHYLCSRDKRFHPYRPNEYVDVYDDPRSRHWLTPR